MKSDDVPMVIVGEMDKNAYYSTLGARIFYYAMYGFFYLSVYMYPNNLSEYLRDGDYSWFVGYFICHLLAIWLFATTHRNPGIVDPDLHHLKDSESENSQE